MSSIPKSKLMMVDFDPSDKSFKFKTGQRLPFLEMIFQHECKKCHIYFHGISLSTQEVFSSCFPNSRSLHVYKVYADLRRRGFKVSEVSDVDPEPSTSTANIVPTTEDKSPELKRRKLDVTGGDCLQIQNNLLPKMFLTMDHLKSGEFVKDLLYKNMYIKSWNHMRRVETNPCDEEYRGQLVEVKSSSEMIGRNFPNSIIDPSVVQTIPEVFKAIQEHAPKVENENKSEVKSTFRIRDSSSNDATVFVDDGSSSWLETILYNLDSTAIVAVGDTAPSYFRATPFEIWDETWDEKF